MTPEQLIGIAGCAVNRAMRRSRHMWREEERRDAQQEALVAILEVLSRKSDAGTGYLFRTALLEVWLWMRKCIRRRATIRLSPHIDRWAQSDEPESSAVARLLAGFGGLERMLRSQRVSPGVLTEGKVRNEIEFLRCLLEGCSVEEAAFRMAMTRRNAYAIRERLLPRLERIAAGMRPQKAEWRISENSLKALRRINSDPELLANRTQAIRAGKARQFHNSTTR
jgi:hypothetical protein